MLSSSTPASAANRICTRLSRRAAILPPLDRTLSCSRSPWSRSTRYFTFIAAPDLDGSRDEPEQNRRPPRFSDKQGQYLAFIHSYTVVLGRPPAEADLQRHFRVTPASVHQMILTLERHGFIERTPGAPR